MVKETKRICGTNMSISKCGGAAVTKGNGSVKRTLTSNGMAMDGYINSQSGYKSLSSFIRNRRQGKKRRITEGL